ncbi:MAG: hypothetical protein O2972_04305 [Cyanobacteria bacterium]|jgi:hypothetical protein|nr:hypothetical protein [Synechococcus sp. BS307-5m-G38]MDA0257895.1 hypothetical protein [Cyanobacteriota bacterium]|tara:strand:- start:77 stop:271 length:195 start_codon:yes stop_codon:yes gene_type:complete
MIAGVEWTAAQALSAMTVQSSRKIPEGSPSPWSPIEFGLNLAPTYWFDWLESKEFWETIFAELF